MRHEVANDDRSFASVLHDDRWIAGRPGGGNAACRLLATPRLWPGGFLPLLILPAVAWLVSAWLPRWGFMWAMAFAIYAGCKWLTYREARVRGVASARLRLLGYLLAWPGMDAAAFLGRIDRPARPDRWQWTGAGLRTLLGAALIWGVVRTALPIDTLLAGWIGMVGLTLLLHFGTFHLLSLGWRRIGVNAMPIMQHPLRSSSLAELWARRWNTAFHELAARFTFRPLRPIVGPTGAALLVFLISGLIHELVITIPAQGGYGLPTGYFVLQGLGVAAERTRLGQRVGLARGWRGRLFTVVVAGTPVFWLFPPPFVRQIILPMLAFIGAI